MRIAAKYGKSSAQVVLRWNIQKGVIVIPKSSRDERQFENINIFDFKLTNDEIKLIDKLDKGQRMGAHPDEITFN